MNSNSKNDKTISLNGHDEYKENERFKRVSDATSMFLKENRPKKGIGNLLNEVVKKGKCIKCGACVSVCSSLSWDFELDQPKLTGKCDLCLNCYYQCPIVSSSQMDGSATPGVTEFKQKIENALENNRIFVGKVSGENNPENIEQRSKIKFQNGGITTAILRYLFETDKIDAAIVTVRDSESRDTESDDAGPDNSERLARSWKAKTIIAESIEDLTKCGGTIYTHSLVIPPLFEAVFKAGHRRIAFVGTPCNINAVKSALNDRSGFLSNVTIGGENSAGNANVKDNVIGNKINVFTIGIFCMEAFEPNRFYPFLMDNDVDLHNVDKMEISGGKFKLLSKGERVKAFGIKTLEDYTESSCAFCKDLVSWNADISIGNIGSADNLNTIICNTEESVKILNEMKEKSLIELNQISEKNENTEGLDKLIQSGVTKEEKEIPESVPVKRLQKDSFILHNIREWAKIDFGYHPKVSTEKYYRVPYTAHKIKSLTKRADSEKSVTKSKLDEKPEVFVAKAPDLDGEELIPYNYSSAYDLTHELLKDYDRIKGGKVFIKPNNTGFVGVFKTEKLKHVLEQNGITDNADDQPIATQPSIIKGMVDALLDLGASIIHIGENMLWTGGAPRAFLETGYMEALKDPKYSGKVFFIDFYENDPPLSSLKRIPLELDKYSKVDYYTRCFPPKALFEEKYDLIYIASVIKTHNCSHYSLSVKNFSVTWNPRKKTGSVAPRWHIHGLPINIFLKKNVKAALGEDFKRKYKYLVREVFKYPFKKRGYSAREVKKKNRKVIVTNEFTSSGLMDTITSFKNEALDVDPHHWTGITMAIMNLGMGYLITRYTRIFSSILTELHKQGTRVACLSSGIVAQEKDGPLIYGSKKYAGFSVASFDHVALERVTLDIMFGTDNEGFRGYIVNQQKEMMKQYGITHPDLIKDARDLWMLSMLKDKIGGELEPENMDITLLDYRSQDSENYKEEISKLDANSLYLLRRGAQFIPSRAFFVSPTTWLRVMHTDDNLAMNAFVADKKTIEIPLIPGVTK